MCICAGANWARACLHSCINHPTLVQVAEKGFWHNNVTGESTWKLPEALGHRAKGSNESYWIVDVRPSFPAPGQLRLPRRARAPPAAPRPHLCRHLRALLRAQRQARPRP